MHRLVPLNNKGAESVILHLLPCKGHDWSYICMIVHLREVAYISYIILGFQVGSSKARWTKRSDILAEQAKEKKRKHYALRRV